MIALRLTFLVGVVYASWNSSLNWWCSIFSPNSRQINIYCHTPWGHWSYWRKKEGKKVKERGIINCIWQYVVHLGVNSFFSSDYTTLEKYDSTTMKCYEWISAQKEKHSQQWKWISIWLNQRSKRISYFEVNFWLPTRKT